MSAFVLIAEFEVESGGLDQLMAEALKEAAAVRRDEPGCLRFDVSTSLEDENRGVFYEVFEDEAALETHRQTPHFAAFFDGVADLEVSWDVNRYRLHEPDLASTE